MSMIKLKTLFIINKYVIFVENSQHNEIKEEHNIPKTSGNYGMFWRKY